tara:strand:- start:180 stop:1091 length:912 start_codon:yes stop_codon:yes gene_type:complete
MLFLGTTISGCLGDSFSNNTDDISISSPIWAKSDFWEYSVKTSNLEISTTMVVSIDNDATDYYIGTGSLEDAKRHAVLNHNPALGRVQMSDFSVYENNEPQKIIDFPLKTSKSWSFALYGENEFVASVIEIEKGLAEISAVSDSGARISYIFSQEARWFSYFEFTNANGETILSMELANYGTGFTGNAYFCRGGDLYDKEFEGPDLEVYDTVYVSEGHQRYGNWNYILYFLEANTGGSGSGELTLKDHLGTELLFETFSPGVTKNEMGSVEGNSGNWTFEIALSGDSYVRMRIAGAIQYTYAV